MAAFIHHLADVKTVAIGDKTNIWQFAIVLEGARIGSNCNINCHTFIENDVVIGDNVTVKSGVYLWDGMRLENNVFIGPNVTFINDKFPRSKVYPSDFKAAHVQHGASIGGGATILGGVKIGRFALVGAGSVVTKDVPHHAMVYGNPATINGWVNEKGTVLKPIGAHDYVDDDGIHYTVKNQQLIKTETP